MRATPSATLLYRIAAVILVLFAAGHTFGFLSFTPPTPEGVAVRDAMDSVHFAAGGATLSYGGFYRGFGLSITVNTLFIALLAWHLGTLARTAPQSIGTVGWAFLAAQLAGLALSFKYFAPVPAAFSFVVVICVGWAAIKVA
jgi:hypothetical protein